MNKDQRQEENKLLIFAGQSTFAAWLTVIVATLSLIQNENRNAGQAFIILGVFTFIILSFFLLAIVIRYINNVNKL